MDISSLLFIRENYKHFNERISDKETGGTICEKVHRGQETIGFKRCEDCIDIILEAVMHVVG